MNEYSMIGWKRRSDAAMTVKTQAHPPTPTRTLHTLHPLCTPAPVRSVKTKTHTGINLEDHSKVRPNSRPPLCAI